MSDHSISIVPKLSSYPGKEIKAKEILEWLISLDIVKPEPSDCVLGSSNGYAISNGAKKVTAGPDFLPFDLIANGLEIVTEKQVFDTGENGIEQLICPDCKQDSSSDDWSFFSEWMKNENNFLTCSLCGQSSDIQNYIFIPQWGFSDLGFIFWNWPSLTDDFLNDFKQKLDCDINIVNNWI